MNKSVNNIIELKNVSYSDNQIDIIKNITGSFKKGKITTIIGPSGAGKTTLFRLMNGLITPTKGEILINGENITSYEPVELRRNVGLALQSATMLDGTVYKNLALPKTLKGETLSKADANKHLIAVGLEHTLLNRSIKDLSGGQRQRVSFARTLVNKPSILLLDEITSSLDRISKQEIEELITNINQTFDVTIIWITHNIEQAMEMGDHTWVMMDGELVESGKSALLTNPENNLVKRFLKGEFT